MPELAEFLGANPAALAAVLFLLGCCFGSFINVVALRLPLMMRHGWESQCRELLEIEEQGNSPEPPNLVRPPSRCPHCGNSLKWHHNLPVIGYLLLLGKCGFCKAPISPRYPVVEALCGLLAVLIGLYFEPGLGMLFALGLTFALVALSLVDFDHHLLPDSIVLPLLWAGLIANSLGLFTDLQSAVSGAIAGYLVLWIIYQAHRLLTGREGMGYGDFKLLAALGAWLGWQALPVIILLASVSGILIAVFTMILKRQGKDVPFAFGPYLAIGGWVVLVFGDSVLADYLGLFNL